MILILLFLSALEAYWGEIHILYTYTHTYIYIDNYFNYFSSVYTREKLLMFMTLKSSPTATSPEFWVYYNDLLYLRKLHLPPMIFGFGDLVTSPCFSCIFFQHLISWERSQFKGICQNWLNMKIKMKNVGGRWGHWNKLKTQLQVILNCSYSCEFLFNLNEIKKVSLVLVHLVLGFFFPFFETEHVLCLFLYSKRVKDWTRRIGNDRHLICIEDPFKVTHDLGRVVDKYSIRVLREEFERAAEIMQYDLDPCTALFQPYVPNWLFSVLVDPR